MPRVSVLYVQPRRERENNLPWIEHQIDEQSIECDDKHSEISSESSGEAILTNETQTILHRHSRDHSLWDEKEIDETLHLLPGAEEIIQMITWGNQLDISCPRLSCNVALLITSWYGCVEHVNALLSNSRADPNTTDPKGRSPLHFACSIGEHQIAKVLLDHGADPNRWDNENKSTPLHCAASAGSIECILLLLKRKAQINVGIETRSALHYAVDNNSLECAEILLKYGANPNTPQVYTETPLHTAAALGHKECVELLLKYGADVRSQFGKRKLTALHLAAEGDYVDCVKLLLEHGAQVDARNADNQTPLHLACLAQCTETVELLLINKANVNASYKDGRTALHAAIVKQSKCLECARMLVKAGIDVNKADDYGYSPLHMAALNEFGSCVILLIDHGADITARTNGGVPALSFIVRRTPEVIPKLISKLDHCIKVNDHEIGDVDCEIKLDFRLLVPTTERGETEMLKTFIEVGQKRLLNHPLCETFLFLKWRRIRKFFLLSLCYHAIYVLLFTFYVMSVYMQHCSKEKPCRVSELTPPFGYLVVSLNLILLGKEFFQMGQGFYGYAKYWENWLQWSIVCGVFLCVTPETLSPTRDSLNVPPWQYHIAAVVVFLVWLELMMLVGRFPIFGLYVQMFTKVAVNFGKFLMAYFCLLVAFALSFCVLFPTYPAFRNVGRSIMKMIPMMSGELEFEDIFFGDYPPTYPVTSQVLFLAFVLLVTIILTNLVVGLAVSDIQGLQESAGLDRLIRQTELVSRLESLFFSRLLRKAPPKLMSLCQRSALLRTSRYQLQFLTRPNDPRDRQLPEGIKMNIYKLVAERRDRNQSIRRKRDHFMSTFQRNINRDSHKDDIVTLRGQPSLNRKVRVLSDSPHNYFKYKENNANEYKVNYNDAVQDIIKIKLQLSTVSEKLDSLTDNLTKQLSAIAEEFERLKGRQPNRNIHEMSF
ncbi:unnamed protein product [Hermetia illucens]|uniref:Ion transport domain-containing protein n=1 Tax=Hermetia illucens TaxID=343691 RepID=A0A7R8UNF0_HERIL|nr:transient receptor potential channel pyrexia isoform X1 [Hermetia illucens]CAD7084027.1 unnamed protein product [Hermetia illucens]